MEGRKEGRKEGRIEGKEVDRLKADIPFTDRSCFGGCYILGQLIKLSCKKKKKRVDIRYDISGVNKAGVDLGIG